MLFRSDRLAAQLSTPFKRLPSPRRTENGAIGPKQTFGACAAIWYHPPLSGRCFSRYNAVVWQSQALDDKAFI